MQNESNLVWIDMEMTGLRPEKDRILEIATIVTDSQLNILAEGPVIAVRQSEEILAGMDEWCTTHHTASGLLERVRTQGVSEAEAEVRTLAFIQQYVPEKASPLCGNSIGQDRRFMYAYMPKLEAYFHYRNLDVSSLKIVANLWKPQIMAGFTKKEAHLALDDIRESIAELRYYKENLLAL
ncbi:MAG: oligoribonuclease [Victivallales bacterium]|nr:oligoribonuclease [Victivallales bacterium]